MQAFLSISYDLFTIDNRVALYCIRKGIFWKYLQYFIIVTNYIYYWEYCLLPWCYTTLQTCTVTAFFATSMAYYIYIYICGIMKMLQYLQQCLLLCGFGILLDVWNGWQVYVFRLTFICLNFLEEILRYCPMPRPLGLGNLENICCNV